MYGTAGLSGAVVRRVLWLKNQKECVAIKAESKNTAEIIQRAT